MLELDSVSRRFGDVQALDSVSFSVRPGGLTGFVGANGAGKTTAMRVVLGITQPDSGEVRWRGGPLDLGVRSRFGYMPEERGLYPRMRLTDQLVFLARLHGVGATDAADRARELLTRLGLGDRAGDRLDALSLGNQQRVQVAAALIHSPELLILDEPFSGLDPIAVDAMTDLLREQALAGVPVLFSSHQLDLVERLCDDVVIIDHGRVAAAGDADELRRRGSSRDLHLVVEPDAGWLRDVTGIPGLDVLDIEGASALVRLADPSRDQDLLALALRHGRVQEFSHVRRSLAELYREVVA